MIELLQAIDTLAEKNKSQVQMLFQTYLRLPDDKKIQSVCKSLKIFAKNWGADEELITLSGMIAKFIIDCPQDLKDALFTLVEGKTIKDDWRETNANIINLIQKHTEVNQ